MRADLASDSPTRASRVRTGIGYDVHRLTAGRPLILGGVQIDHELGLDGHSDADVLTHAIIDALLGAACLGDIGYLFPDTDEQFRGADSLVLLAEVVERIGEAGYAIVNVDSTVVIQRPKLRPHIDEMRATLAEVLGIDVSAVSVKATTGEQMGFAGREEGVAAQAICLLMPATD